MKHPFCFSALVQPGRTFARKNAWITCWVAILAAFCIGANAQELAALDKVYHPAEQAHVIVTFAAPLSCQVAESRSACTNLKMTLNASGRAASILTQLKRLQPNQYEATGAIPEYAASGLYRLIRAWSGVSDLTKSYDSPDTLRQDITIRVINEKRDPLPAPTELKILK